MEWDISPTSKRHRGEQGAAQPLGGSNVSGLTEEAERAKGLSSYSPAHRRKGRGHPMRNHGAHAVRLGWRVFVRVIFIVKMVTFF